MESSNTTQEQRSVHKFSEVENSPNPFDNSTNFSSPYSQYIHVSPSQLDQSGSHKNYVFDKDSGKWVLE